MKPTIEPTPVQPCLPPTAAIRHLCDQLNAAFETGAPASASPLHANDAAFAQRVRSALAAAVADPELLDDPAREGNAHGYRRHLLAADAQGRYAIAALVWMPGQASPVHAHHTWCSYAVVEGELTESLYGWNEARGDATALRTQPRAAGAVSFTRAGHAAIHRLVNESGRRAVSLHVYGVAGAQIATHVNDLVRVAEGGIEAVSSALHRNGPAIAPDTVETPAHEAAPS
ncbi:cysteine dioxygenase family protein [Paraburkholderia kururiensis]|uniref:Cysteine dioxygenase family protein n=1 Tax=Paraburkholderia kururiensis TaxID=984307 RepID=A0ABZ0WSL2_9BURK|nr:cysteine dioxygenase family protein [Paraburkholderia kururiensis]WQD80399.1 cysteine dioxygenase family protein [Paraburkholderia kururiensis]